MNIWTERLSVPSDLKQALGESPGVVLPTGREMLYELMFGSSAVDRVEVCCRAAGETFREAEVVRCRNGAVVNFTEDYMRRRDPDSMRIADGLPTDKPRFEDVYGCPFAKLRQETMAWLAGEELILLPFLAGGRYEALLVCPRWAAFFAYALSGMQAFTDLRQYDSFTPRCIIYVAPPFRHTHFGGKQVVVHSRGDIHEIFSYNLYPGPSAKKGVYSFLLDLGEGEGWTTDHASCARVTAQGQPPVVMMHEGASGGGKSELLQPLHRENGRILLDRRLCTGENHFIQLTQTCAVEPVVDDMALCCPTLQKGGKLAVADGEDGWFVRVDGIRCYGCDPACERRTIQPPEPLMFFNLQAVPGATCLPWEHIPDTNGTPCPNPRVIIPRRLMEGVVSGPVEVDIRSFGVRMPPASRGAPTCGVAGLLHILPPALAWLWRLVAPRGYNNPSITSAHTLESEGVGSYWPFATGRRVRQANLLLEQIIDSPQTWYALIPNQHIGGYEVGFAPEWLAREWLARRGGARPSREELCPTRCPLFGWALRYMELESQAVPAVFLRPELQSELGEEGYDAGTAQLADFFKAELEQFDTPDLHPLGRDILTCFKENGGAEDYERILPTEGK